MSYNKKRNSLFLYEVLIRTLTNSVISEDKEKRKQIISIIRKYFSRGTAVYEDWRLHKALINLESDSIVSEKILNETKKMYGLINQTILFKEQSFIIKDINKLFDHSIFSTFIPNYKTIATINQILNGKYLSPNKRVMLEEELLKHNNISKKEEKYEPISNLTFKTFIGKFNKSYSSLLKEQQELLQKYAMADERGLEFKIYLNEEISRLKETLKSISETKEIKEDKEITIKTYQVLSLLESYSQKQKIDQNMVGEILKIQQLCQEIQTREI